LIEIRARDCVSTDLCNIPGYTIISLSAIYGVCCIVHLFLAMRRSTIHVYYTCFYQCEGRLSMYITLVSINGKVDYPCIYVYYTCFYQWKVDYPCILHLFLSIGRSTIHVSYTCFYQWECRLSMYITLVSINRKVHYLFILHLFLFLDRSTIHVYYTCFYQLEGRLSMYTTLVSINVKVDYPCILHLVLSMGRSPSH
jgi:hypothetical protein